MGVAFEMGVVALHTMRRLPLILSLKIKEHGGEGETSFRLKNKYNRRIHPKVYVNANTTVGGT